MRYKIWQSHIRPQWFELPSNLCGSFFLFSSCEPILSITPFIGSAMSNMSVLTAFTNCLFSSWDCFIKSINLIITDTIGNNSLSVHEISTGEVDDGVEGAARWGEDELRSLPTGRPGRWVEGVVTDVVGVGWLLSSRPAGCRAGRIGVVVSWDGEVTGVISFSGIVGDGCWRLFVSLTIMTSMGRGDGGGDWDKSGWEPLVFRGPSDALIEADGGGWGYVGTWETISGGVHCNRDHWSGVV